MPDFVEKYLNKLARTEEVQAYEDSLKTYRDLKNSLDTAREEGMEEGRKQIALEIVKNALAAGLSVAVIAQISGLSVEEIERIKGEG